MASKRRRNHRKANATATLHDPIPLAYREKQNGTATTRDEFNRAPIYDPVVQNFYIVMRSPLFYPLPSIINRLLYKPWSVTVDEIEPRMRMLTRVRELFEDESCKAGVELVDMEINNILNEGHLDEYQTKVKFKRSSRNVKRKARQKNKGKTRAP